MPRTDANRRSQRGFTLLEAMISLTILLVGLVGMARLQIYGMSSTQGARAHTIATQLAIELGNALASLPSDDLRLTGAVGATPSAPPATFGALLPLGVPSTGVTEWSDGTAVPGARLDTALERDPIDSTKPVYRRRWTVWNAGVAANGAAAKIIAVSVIYRERNIPRPREVVMYFHSEIRGSFMSNLTAFN